MACPTCDHTMQSLGTGNFVWWCPRCGTAKGSGIESDKHYETPDLVIRIAKFASGFLDESTQARFEKLGIRESICLEE